MAEPGKGVEGLGDALSDPAAACLPGEAGYDEAVASGTARSRDGRPSSCAAPADGDVAAALAFAEARGLEVSVRGGGHNYAGFALTDGGLMIDLTPMKAVTVDPGAQRRDVRRRHDLG